MSVFETVQNAIATGDAKKYSDLYDDDFEFVRHQTGTSMNKAEMTAMIPEMMGNGIFKSENYRLIYENDDILVDHSIMDFPDGTREAVLGVNTLRNGKIVRLETGATPLK